MELSTADIALMSRLLDEALPLDDAERQTWLDNLPPEHRPLAPALRAALLKGVAQAEVFRALATPPRLDTGAEASAVPTSDLQPGERVGPYELIKLLGTGGMAEVWLARRADGALKREVALKLPRLSRLRADLEPRFARERDILASLEHPHIARLYDAGVDPQGLPYLAMEYVQGAPLTDWCDAHRLGIAGRLTLFLQVLEAVQYAHEKQVIHRDLKSSNILVTESGQVRLLDFGIAGLLEAETTGQLALTSVYGRALTPDCASPELLRGDPIDARSDLYSLGVLLYELLTGTRPYRLKGAASIGALDQAIATLEVKKPSTQIQPEAVAARATTHDSLARQLRDDLDAIALKALAKQPADRYPSAAALAEDLQRHGEGRPIQAQPARFPYRLRKFVRRNKVAVGISAIAASAIVAAAGYTLYREAVYKVKVMANAVAGLPSAIPEKSIAVLPFVNMSSDKEQDYFSDGLTEEMIELLGQVPDLRVPARTSSFYFKGKNETIANIAQQLKVAHVLEGSVRKAGKRLRITAQLIRADNGYHLWSQAYDRDDADVFAVQDDIAKAVVSALQVKLAAGAQETGSRGTTSTEAYYQYLLGRELDRRGSLESFRHAFEAYSKATVLDPNYAAAYAGLALAGASVADYTGDTSGLERAGHDADKAIALAPTDANGYAARSYLRTDWLWDWSSAQADIEKALSLDPRNSEVQQEYARLLADLGRLPEAIAAQKEAKELDPLSSTAWENLGFYYKNIGDYTAAATMLGRAIEIEPTSVFALSDLGMTRLLQGDGQEALEAFRKEHQEALGLTGIAMTEHTLGHPKESQQAMDALIAKHAQHAAYQIAEAFAWRGEKDRAFEWLERAYKQRDGGLSLIKTDPPLSSLHTDPRFGALLREIKLPE
jgi:serine/threonine protein kinase